jgi:hypothetical protein
MFNICVQHRKANEHFTGHFITLNSITITNKYIKKTTTLWF